MADGLDDAVVVADVTSDFAWLDLKSLPLADLVVSPLRTDGAGRGVYSESSVGLVKALKADGVEAAFLDTSEQRTFVTQKSAELLVAIVVGVMSNAAWSALIAIFKRAATKELDLTVYRTNTGGETKFFHAKGASRSVIRVLGQAAEFAEPDGSDGPVG